MARLADFTIAAVQAAPVYFDTDRTTDKACVLIESAAQKGADLVAFGESFIPGYPLFSHYPDMYHREMGEYIANAVEIPSPTTDRLCATAKRNAIDVVIGIVERESTTQGTIYCTLLFMGREGKIIGRHRKLKPTMLERVVWGDGDGRGLQVYERPYGRISGLNCFEHRMILPGYSLMAGGTQVHVAAWPFDRDLDREKGTGRLLSRAFACSGGCYVIATCNLISENDVPERYRDRLKAAFAKWEELGAGPGGGCCIIPPGTTGWGSLREPIVEAPHGEESVIIAKASHEEIYQAKAIVDVGGHYSRPDVIQLRVNRDPQLSINDFCATEFNLISENELVKGKRVR